MTKIRDTEYIKQLGLRLRKLRIRIKLSQEELAFSADIPISQIGRIERGEINVTVSTLYAIAKALNTHPKNLLNFDIL